MAQKEFVNASLLFRDSSEIKHILLLPAPEIKFGRDPSNDIRLALFPQQDIVFQLATADISRHHFVIRRREKGYTIQDLGSTNGTSVSCIAVLKNEKTLGHNETIDIGGVLDLKVSIKEKAMLLLRRTNTPQEAYLLFDDTITIGSADDNSLVLALPEVSSHHVRIRYQDKRYTVCKVDPASTVAVNNTPLEVGSELPLEDESHISLVGTDILFNIQKT